MSEKDMIEAEWVSISEAGRRVGLSRNRVQSMIDRREVRMLAMGRRPMISLVDVKRVMMEMLTPAK